MGSDTNAVKRIGFIPIVSIVLATVGVIAPILWSYYTNTSSIEIRLESSLSLLKDDPLLKEDLVITYKGKPVTGLTRMDFLLLNKGRTPITQSDIYDAPKITFGEESKLIAAIVTSKNPPNLAAR